MTEYAIILVAIAVICLAIAVSFGGKIQRLFGVAGDGVDGLADEVGAADTGSPFGGEGSDGAASDGGEGGGSSGSPAGGSRSGAGGGIGSDRSAGGGAGNGSAGGTRVITPSSKPQTGTRVHRSGDRTVTVTAPGRNTSTVRYADRDAREHAQAQARHQAEWQARRADVAADQEEAAKAAKPSTGLSFIRGLLLAALLAGVLVLGRMLLGGGKHTSTG